jgi:hypothetical protein
MTESAAGRAGGRDPRVGGPFGLILRHELTGALVFMALDADGHTLSIRWVSSHWRCSPATRRACATCGAAGPAAHPTGLLATGPPLPILAGTSATVVVYSNLQHWLG